MESASLSPSLLCAPRPTSSLRETATPAAGQRSPFPLLPPRGTAGPCRLRTEPLASWSCAKPSLLLCATQQARQSPPMALSSISASGGAMVLFSLPGGKARRDDKNMPKFHTSFKCSNFLQGTPNLTLHYGWKMRWRSILLPNVQKHCRVVRGATTEEMEAEKELIEEDALERMEKTLESVKGNFNTVRTGRASPALLDRVEVEYYGSPVTLKSIAQVSTPDGSSLLIQPFDKSSLSSIEKAISKSDVGLTPSNDGMAIRLFIPPLTAERRKELLKMVNKLSEEGKIAIRNIRRDAIKAYEKLEKEKKLSEDNVKDLSVSMQKITDDYVKKIEVMFKQKEKELMTV